MQLFLVLFISLSLSNVALAEEIAEKRDPMVKEIAKKEGVEGSVFDSGVSLLKAATRGKHLAFQDQNNMIAAQFAPSVTSLQFGGLYFLSGMYSLKTTFVMNGRLNFEIGGILGKVYYTNNGTLNQGLFGVMYEAIFNVGDLFYFGAGLGGYIRTSSSKQNSADPIESAFVFGERFSIGIPIDRFNIEISYRHFSNGGLTTLNKGFDFFSILVGYRF